MKHFLFQFRRLFKGPEIGFFKFDKPSSPGTLESLRNDLFGVMSRIKKFPLVHTGRNNANMFLTI